MPNLAEPRILIEGDSDMERIYVDKYTGRLERTDLYLVRLTMKDGSVYENLEPRKLFPFTNHTMYISLLDSREKELAFIRNLDELDPDSRRAVEECFEEYYMIPKISRILSCAEKYETLKWVVETDRGEIAFDITNRIRNIKHLRGTKRVLIRDSNDNRYEIPDYTKMDAHSSRILFTYL